MSTEIAITSKPNVMGGAWCIDGHRIEAATIQDFAKAGYTVDEINEQFPTLTPEKIEAAIAWEGPPGRKRTARPTTQPITQDRR